LDASSAEVVSASRRAKSLSITWRSAHSAGGCEKIGGRYGKISEKYEEFIELTGESRIEKWISWNSSCDFFLIWSNKKFDLGEMVIYFRQWGVKWPTPKEKCVPKGPKESGIFTRNQDVAASIMPMTPPLSPPMPV
jgi:hypothetical protein